MTDIEALQDLYNKNAEYEKDRLIQTPIHELEFELTIDVLKRYIRPYSKVLDLGSGPGVYSTYLINELNCNVALVDISEEELNIFKTQSEERALDRVEFIKVDSATEVSWIPDSSFDHILIQGPLYHLLDQAERDKVLLHANRILKRNGMVFCAFISPHPRYVDIFEHGTGRIKDDDYLSSLANGITEFKCHGFSASQYRCWPSEAVSMMEGSGFRVLNCRNLEGVFSYLSHEYLQLLQDDEVKRRFIDLAKSTCEEPSLLGSTLHFLISAQKKV